MSASERDEQPAISEGDGRGWKQRLQRLYGSGSFWLLLAPSGSFWLHVLRAKWVERNAGGWERNSNAVKVCGADRAVEPVKLVESVELVEHTTWSGNVQYVVVGVLHGL